MKCLNCEGSLEGKRIDAKFCSDKCTKAYSRKSDKKVMSDTPNSDNVPDNAELLISDKNVTAVNTIPVSKGGKWVDKFPYKENGGMCKYCGKMSYLIDNVTVDEMIECCHKCASLKNER